MSSTKAGSVTRYYYLGLSDIKVTVANPSGIDQLAVEPVYDGYTYTITGVRVDEDQLRPGIYIRNGKKFVVR